MTADRNSEWSRSARHLGRECLVVAALVLLATACGDGETTTGTDGEVPLIVATTSIWGDVVGNLACDGLADVRTILPIGSDPHAFEPSLQDRSTMENAVLVVANGLLLEESLEDTLDAVEQAGTPVVRIAESIDTIEFTGGEPGHEEETHEAGETDDEHGGADPHVWFDPQRVSAVVPELAERLVDDAGLDAAAVQACLDAYQAQLAEVDAEIEGLLEAIPAENRLLVTNHEALGYFADRYGFEVIGTVIPSPSTLAETNPAELEELAVLIEENAVPAVFAESQHSSADADALAERVGDTEVVTLFTDSLGDEASGADSYVDMLRTTATLVADALS